MPNWLLYTLAVIGALTVGYWILSLLAAIYVPHQEASAGKADITRSKWSSDDDGW